jgi:hypothetical protein
MDKIKPTKVTKEDVELADEISHVVTIKGLVSAFTSYVEAEFEDLIYSAETGNPVKVYKHLLASQTILLTEAQSLQRKLLEVLGLEDDVQNVESEMAIIDSELAPLTVEPEVFDIPAIFEPVGTKEN